MELFIACLTTLSMAEISNDETIVTEQRNPGRNVETAKFV
jgi:hypothetical protein